jgi:hypothetical protein
MLRSIWTRLGRPDPTTINYWFGNTGAVLCAVVSLALGVSWILTMTTLRVLSVGFYVIGVTVLCLVGLTLLGYAERQTTSTKNR